MNNLSRRLPRVVRLGSIMLAAIIFPTALAIAQDFTTTNGNTNSPEALQKRLESVKQAVDRFSAAHDDAKAEWRKARDAYRTARETAKLAAALEAWKKHLTKAIEMYLRHFDALKLETVSDTTTIDAAITKLNEYKAEIAGATTKEELSQIAQEFRTYIQSLQKISKQSLGKRLTNGMTQVYDKLTALASRIETKLAALAEEGIDTAQAEDALAQGKLHLTTAKTKLDEAKALVTAITEANKKENMQKAQEAMAIVRTELKETHRLLKEAINLVKAQAPETEG